MSLVTPRFGQRLGLPRPQGRVAQQAPRIGSTGFVQWQLIGLDATGAKSASAAVNSGPASQGPSKRRSPSLHSSSSRRRSLRSLSVGACSRIRTPTFMEHWLRSSAKPACISAHAQRDHARAEESTGQTSEWRSARYSMIASESQTVVAPSCRHGTRAEGENSRNATSLDWPSKKCNSSRKAIARARSKAHGRNDQEE
jgi:hypothetical protein